MLLVIALFKVITVNFVDFVEVLCQTIRTVFSNQLEKIMLDRVGFVNRNSAKEVMLNGFVHIDIDGLSIFFDDCGHSIFKLLNVQSSSSQ